MTSKFFEKWLDLLHPTMRAQPNFFNDYEVRPPKSPRLKVTFVEAAEFTHWESWFDDRWWVCRFAHPADETSTNGVRWSGGMHDPNEPPPKFDSEEWLKAVLIVSWGSLQSRSQRWNVEMMVGRPTVRAASHWRELRRELRNSGQCRCSDCRSGEFEPSSN
jgi:hypothetical protein